jgi:hypothetical protein
MELVRARLSRALTKTDAATQTLQLQQAPRRSSKIVFGTRFLGGRSFCSDNNRRRAAPPSRGAFSASLRPLRVPDPSALSVGLHGNARAAAFQSLFRNCEPRKQAERKPRRSRLSAATKSRAPQRLPLAVPFPRAFQPCRKSPVDKGVLTLRRPNGRVGTEPGGAQRLPLAVPLPRAFLLNLLCLLNLLRLQGDSPYCAGIITRT